jgi:hypothetical protein
MTKHPKERTYSEPAHQRARQEREDRRGRIAVVITDAEFEAALAQACVEERFARVRSMRPRPLWRERV